MTHGGECATWTLGLMALPGQPWDGPGQGSLGVLNLTPHLHCASLALCRWAFDGLMAPVMGLGVAWQAIFVFLLMPFSL